VIVEKVPVAPVGPVTEPPAATRSGGHAARQPPVQTDPVLVSDDSVYRVMPFGPTRKDPSDAPEPDVSTTLAGGVGVAVGDGVAVGAIEAAGLGDA
jgi:hypothetical protein